MRRGEVVDAVVGPESAGAGELGGGAGCYDYLVVLVFDGIDCSIPQDKYVQVGLQRHIYMKLHHINRYCNPAIESYFCFDETGQKYSEISQLHG